MPDKPPVTVHPPQPNAVIFGNRRNALIAKCSDDRPLWSCSVTIGECSEDVYGIAKTRHQFTDAVAFHVISNIKRLSERERSQAMAEELKAEGE